MAIGGKGSRKSRGFGCKAESLFFATEFQIMFYICILRVTPISITILLETLKQ
jgi:hypothetical protein